MVAAMRLFLFRWGADFTLVRAESEELARGYLHPNIRGQSEVTELPSTDAPGIVWDYEGEYPDSGPASE